MAHTQTGAALLEWLITEAAIAVSRVASDRGEYVNETEVLYAAQQDPNRATARALQTMFNAALRGAQNAVAA
jgi:hypothetical protein